MTVTFSHHSHGRNVLIQEVIVGSAPVGSGSTLCRPPSAEKTKYIDRIKKEIYSSKYCSACIFMLLMCSVMQLLETSYVVLYQINKILIFTPY